MEGGMVEIMMIGDSKPPAYINGVYKVYASGPGVISARTGTKINAGFKMKIPENYFGKIQRSVIKTLGGVVDSDYRGEICILVYNDTDEEFIYRKGDEVGEMVVCKIAAPVIEVID